MNLKLKLMLIKDAKIIYKNENSGHDFSHIKRVLKYCNIIQKSEGGEKDVIFVSALFHDVHRVLCNEKGKYISAEESLPFVKTLLQKYDFEQKFLKRVLACIEKHEDKTMDCKNNLELKILQDADVLDSLGKIGLRRTLTYCKNKNIPISNKDYDLDCDEYIPNIFPISTTHFVYRTMIPSVKLIKTTKGKMLAKNLVSDLNWFIEKNMK